jgi:alpha,alpha-trehalase
VLANYRVYRNINGSMWEKYNVVEIAPKTGSGGEYDVQAGFGWTNGVVLDLLATYGDRMYFHNLEENPTEVCLPFGTRASFAWTIAVVSLITAPPDFD